MGDALTYSDDGRQGLGPDCTPTVDEGWYDTLQEEDDANGDRPDKAILIRLATTRIVWPCR